MKQIKVAVLRAVVIPTSPRSVNKPGQLCEEAFPNKGKVIEGAIAIEEMLAILITDYFLLGCAPERKSIFNAIILESDWCTFSAKRKLMRHIVDDLKLLEGAQKADFDELLARVMRYRNAFTHGKLSSDGEKVWISYFEGTPKKVELTDEYLTEVETALDRAFRQVTSLALKPNQPQLAESISPYSAPCFRPSADDEC